MSKLNIDQKTIKGLFQDPKSNFLIPDYQRPYAWGVEECKTLWEDLFSFSFPNNDCDQFNNNDEYFLGPIVTFKNNEGKMEVKIEQTIKKYQKGCTIEQTADMLEESPALIRQIYDILAQYAPDYNVEQIYQELIKQPIA